MYDFCEQPFSQLLKTTGTFAGIGAVFVGTDTFLRNTRDTDDAWNSVIAGACAGSLVGLRTGSFFVSGGAAASMAFAMGMMSIFDGSLGSFDKDFYKKRIEAIYRE